MAKTKKEIINPIREAQKDLWFFALMLRQKYELHTNDIPDLLESVATKWFIENCRAEFIFKNHNIEGYKDALPVLHVTTAATKKEETDPLTINTGLFRSMR